MHMTTLSIMLVRKGFGKLLKSNKLACFGGAHIVNAHVADVVHLNSEMSVHCSKGAPNLHMIRSTGMLLLSASHSLHGTRS